MRRMILAERVQEAVSPDTPILFSESCIYTAAGTAGAMRSLPLSQEQRSGAVVLHIASPLKLALALLALDGVAERILLLSAKTPKNVIDELLIRFEGTVILSDRGGIAGAHLEQVFWREISAAPSDDLMVYGRHDTKWTLTTSGTTGSPKMVAHQFASLARTTRTKGERIRQLRWGLLYDMSRFAGIQVFLQGMLSGGGLIAPDLSSPLSAQVDALVRAKCSALSATPTMWRKLLMTEETKALSLRQVTLGGEIADDSILTALASRFPDARISHVYASTEAGAAFSVTDGKAGFPASYLVSAPDEMKLQVREGRLFVRNRAVQPRYVGQEDQFAATDGFIDTGDVVEQVGDRFQFRGRANGAINVGGDKVFPEEIELHLIAHPGVAAARVYGKSNPIIGQLVAAEVVLIPTCGNHGAVVADLRARCRAVLKPWQVPTSLKVVEHIETNVGGKIHRSLS